jgi:predicted HD phosphohydrolase
MSEEKTVSFSSMKTGTVEDFEFIAANDEQTAKELPERLIDHLQEMAKDDGAYKISRLEHVLQCATRAHRDDADDDWVLAALLHDLGDVLAPFTHGQVAGEIIRPFVREEVAWVVSNHGTFQMFYNKSLTTDQRNSREKFKDHSYYHSAIDFCENWDQCSFDPDYDSKELDFFVPLVKRVFSRKPFSS